MHVMMMKGTQHAVCSSSRSSTRTDKHDDVRVRRPSSKQVVGMISHSDSEASVSYDIPLAQDLKDIRYPIKYCDACAWPTLSRPALPLVPSYNQENTWHMSLAHDCCVPLSCNTCYCELVVAE